MKNYRDQYTALELQQETVKFTNLQQKQAIASLTWWQWLVIIPLISFILPW